MMKVTHYRKIAIPDLEESWENMLPIIESHFVLVASVKVFWTIHYTNLHHF